MVGVRMKPIENIFGFDCGTCEYNRHCYGGNMGNQFRYCQKSAEKIQNLENLEIKLKKQKEVIDKVIKYVEDYTSGERIITYEQYKSELLDILKEVQE